MTRGVKSRVARYCSLGLPECRTVEVVARLRHGWITSTWFPTPLDGVLAAAARRRRLGSGYGHLVDHHHETLPLTCSLRPGGPLGKARWVWAASCARWDGDQITDVRWVHNRGWDHQQANIMGIDGGANPDVGRFKAWRLPAVATVAGEVRWVVLGDPAGIEDLLGDVVQIGKRRGSGEGVVIRWEVRDAGEPDWEAVLWGTDGRIDRPVPARYRSDLGIPDADVVPVDAYRPPYWRTAPTSEGGRFSRQPVEVIAPWAGRPS